MANAYHPILHRHLRVEHVTNAQRQGPVAARSMLGMDAAASRLPFFYTDQYDLGMEYTGYAEVGGYDQVVIRGDVPGLAFVALWVTDGRVVAGMHVNEWDATAPIEALILSGRRIASDRLADPGSRSLTSDPSRAVHRDGGGSEPCPTGRVWRPQREPVPSGSPRWRAGGRWPLSGSGRLSGR